MRRFVCILLSVFVFFVSCKKDEPLQKTIETPRDTFSQTRELSPFSWYYIDATGINRAETVRMVPAVAKRPWTEAIRISSASVAADLENEAPKAYAVVNRVGILEFDGNEVKAYPDVTLFTGKTSGNLVFSENVPLFLQYKNSFFNETSDTKPQQYHTFLSQFSTTTKISSPVLAVENLGFTRESEIVDYVWDGTVWICSVKTLSGDKTSFSYVSWQAKNPLLTLTPVNVSQSILINESQREVFRELKSPHDFSNAPLRLRELLSGIPEEMAIHVTCYTAGGQSPREYIRQKSGDEELPLMSSACIAETWVCAVFQDGTVYLRGALYDKPVFNNGETVAFKLPRLPAGYVYSDCVITGTTLSVAWEETSFFETGRSGFLSVDLNTIIR